jgi:hypothetical protein
VKKPRDHQGRQGVTQEPLVPWDDIAILSPLHSLLGCFDFLLKVVYHLNAVVFNWSYKEKTLGNQSFYTITPKKKIRLTHVIISIHRYRSLNLYLPLRFVYLQLCSVSKDCCKDEQQFCQTWVGGM